METELLFGRYQDLQRYVGWTREDEERIRGVAPLVKPCFPAVIDDFYMEIERHPDARKVITGGAEQINRLKGSLLGWIDELFRGTYDADYVSRRWKVGLRHVQVGLDQVYVNVAMSRLRLGILEYHESIAIGALAETLATRRAINKLIDLDLAIIEDAYQTEFHLRQSRVERLATIGQVAGGVAHELRNPLNVIKTSVYFIRNAKNPSPEKVASHLERIDRQATTADNVITALHDFARLPSPHLQPVAVAVLLNEVVRENELREGVSLHFDCPADLPALNADANQLRIVFGNLVRNAQDAMSTGGTLTLRAHAVPDYVDIEVTDTGVGMNADDLRRIMDPFQSTKARGLGLGLAIAKSILEKHHGRIRVTSTPGTGTTFVVGIPIYRDGK